MATGSGKQPTFRTVRAQRTVCPHNAIALGLFFFNLRPKVPASVRWAFAKQFIGRRQALVRVAVCAPWPVPFLGVVGWQGKAAELRQREGREKYNESYGDCRVRGTQ